MLGNRDRLGHGDIQRGSHRRKRRAQLVRCVRGESPLRLERSLEALQQPVDRVRELGELITRTRQREPLIKVLLGDPAGRRGHRAQWPQHATATHHPSTTETTVMIASANPDCASS